MSKILKKYNWVVGQQHLAYFHLDIHENVKILCVMIN